MTRACGLLDKLNVLRYCEEVRSKVDKNIDKLVVFVYTKCRKCAIIGVRHGIINNE